MPMASVVKEQRRILKVTHVISHYRRLDIEEEWLSAVVTEARACGHTKFVLGHIKVMLKILKLAVNR